MCVKRICVIFAGSMPPARRFSGSLPRLFCIVLPAPASIMMVLPSRSKTKLLTGMKSEPLSVGPASASASARSMPMMRSSEVLRIPSLKAWTSSLPTLNFGCIAASSPARAGQEFLGVKLAHIGLFREHLHVDEGAREHRERLGLELAGQGEIGHHPIVIDGGDRRFLMHAGRGDFHGLVLVGAHPANGLEPAGEEAAEILRPLLHRLVGREDRMDDEIGRHAAEMDDGAAYALLLQLDRGGDIRHHPVGGTGPERRNARGGAAQGDGIDPVGAPSLLARK